MKPIKCLLLVGSQLVSEGDTDPSKNPNKLFDQVHHDDQHDEEDDQHDEDDDQDGEDEDSLDAADDGDCVKV